MGTQESEAIRLSLCKDAEVREFQAGDTIFCAGQAGSTMFVVAEGEVEIWLGPVFAETVTPGGIFGEMALIDGTVRSADALAKTRCKLFAVDERRFQSMVRETPAFALQVMSIMAERLRHANQRIIET